MALTGPEATKSLKKVEHLENELNKIKTTIDEDKTGAKSKEHVKAIVELTEDVSHATIPYWKKVIHSLSHYKKKSIEKNSS